MRDILWPDSRVEKPLARLYADLLEEVGPWGSEVQTASNIMSRYGIAKNTAYKLLGDPPKWLGVERISGEGYKLTIRPTRAFSDRAYDLLLERPESDRMTFVSIPEPELVEDGCRNSWLVSLILACKWKGVSQSDVNSMLLGVIRRVPGWQKSWSLTSGLWSILRSIYRNRSALKGQCSGMELPHWVVEALMSLKKSPFSQNFYKKGSRRDLTSSAPPPVVMLETVFEVVSSEVAAVPPTPVGRRLGVWGEQAPADAAIASPLEVDHSLGATGISRVLISQPAAVESELPEVDPATRALRSDPAVDKTGPAVSSAGAANTFAHLSGRELSGAFSKALMKSQLPASEKARILTLVTSETDPQRKDEMRREWLAKLT